MKELILSICCLLMTTVVSAQLEPVKWSFQAEKVNDKEYDIVITADIENGWSVYSQYLESDNGPVKTSVEFEETSHVKFIGKTNEAGNKKESFDELFGMNLIKYSRKARFTQRIKVDSTEQPITGLLTYMTCDETSCLPPTNVDFSVTLY